MKLKPIKIELTEVDENIFKYSKLSFEMDSKNFTLFCDIEVTQHGYGVQKETYNQPFESDYTKPEIYITDINIMRKSDGFMVKFNEDDIRDEIIKNLEI